MKIQFINLGFLIILVSSTFLLHGQTGVEKTTTDIKVENLKIEYQHKVDSIELKTKYNLQQTNKKSKDTITKVRNQSRIEFASLEKQAETEKNELRLKFRKGIFKGPLRQKHYTQEYTKLRLEYEQKEIHLEKKCKNAINLLESHYGTEIKEITLNAKYKIENIMLIYKKEIALLLPNTN